MPHHLPLIHPLTLSNLSSDCLRIIVTTRDNVATGWWRTNLSEEETRRLAGRVFVGQMSPLCPRRDLFVCKQSSPLIRTISKEKKASVCLDNNPQDRFTLNNW